MRSSLLLAVVASLFGGSGMGVGGETARLDEPFPLSVGRSVSFEGTTMALTFEEVPRDSRCPTGVQCIRAGEALVVLSLTMDGETTRVRLEVPPGGDAEQALGEVTLRVEGLEPEARAGRRIAPDAYVVTLLVSVAGGGPETDF